MANNPTLVDRANAWLDAHPYTKGALTAVEGALGGALIDALGNPNSFSKAGWHQTAITMGGAVVLALRNYFKTAPRKVWTQEERTEKLADPKPPQADSAKAGG